VNAGFRPTPPDDPYRDVRLLVKRLERAIRRQMFMTIINLMIFGWMFGTAIAEIITRYFAP
jgi:hypothetical protein